MLIASIACLLGVSFLSLFFSPVYLAPEFSVPYFPILYFLVPYRHFTTGRPVCIDSGIACTLLCFTL